MNSNCLTSQIKEFSSSIGLDLVAFASAEPLYKAADEIKNQIKKGLIPENNYSIELIDNLCSPRSFSPKAKSVIAVGCCYLEDDEDLDKKNNTQGIIARYTRKNYYKYTRKKLEKLVKFLKKEYQQSSFKLYSCGSIREKPLAERAGLGYYGKHGIIITKNFGSWIVLGEVVTDLELEYDNPVLTDCGNCDLCIKNCPTSAIVEPGIIDRKRCFAYLTSQLEMPLEFRTKWKNRLYGCDTCQEVCPKNKEVKPIKKDFSFGNIGKHFSLISILKMKESEYRNTFRGNQMGADWVPREAIQKNAAIALGNIGNPEALPILIDLMENSNYNLRSYTAWALGQIGTKTAKLALEKALKKESDSKVKEEIENALENI